MRRIGLLGPWHPHDAVDLLLISHLRDALSHAGAELVVVTGHGRERLPWPVPVVAVDGLLATPPDALVVSGDLAASRDVAGIAARDVWTVATGLAAAAGIPVAWYGVRLLGDAAQVQTRSLAVQRGLAPFVLDGASLARFGDAAQRIEHPLSSVPPLDGAGERSGRVVHASPAALAELADASNTAADTWVALRPGRGDRLVGAPPGAQRLRWERPDQVLEAFATASEVVTDDPAVAALAASQGARVRAPAATDVGASHGGAASQPAADRDDADGRGTDEPLIPAAEAWERTVTHLSVSLPPDSGPLRHAMHGMAVEPQPDVVEGEHEGGSRSTAALDQARQAARDAKQRADRWRRDYYRLRGRRSVRIALATADLTRRARRAGATGIVRAVLRRLRARLMPQARPSTPAAGSGPVPSAGVPARSASSHAEASDAGREARARPDVQRVLDSVETSDRTGGPLVSVLVLTRDGAHHLRRLLPALEATRYRDLEVVVVDNGSQEPTRRLLAAWDPGFRVEILRNEHNAGFGEANDQAAAVAAGEYLLLLNDDVEPMEPGWVGHLVTTAERSGAAAVGARLVYPSHAPEDNVGDSSAPPLTLQHRGIHFENRGDGLPRARHLDARGDATSPEACAVHEVPASTAACLLVPREAYDQVGGFSDGYDYGLEDVDLCLKLRAAGHRIVVDGATALWHHEFGTQNVRGAEDKQRRREHNRRRLAAAWGPRLHRQVLRDRLLGERRWSQEPLHVAVTVSRLDEGRRHGDWYSAHELGGALEALGWRVTYVERYQDHWYDLPRDLDVLVVLIDRFDLSLVPDHVLSVAWVRNWTDRWVEHPWFDDYDVVFASSSDSARIVRERSTHEPVLLPLATDPDRFHPDAATPEERCDVVFVGSYWGEERPVARVLAELADEFEVRLYGRGWDEVPDVAALHRGAVAYRRLPAVLASARVVIDDTASPTKPYAAVNTRVFDALAAGSLPVSDNPRGIEQLFATPLPAGDDPAELTAAVRALLRDEGRRRELIDRARMEVLADHTYAERAQRFRDALLAWVDAPRVDVLSGVPDRRVEHRWGDTHYARGFQRQLRRVGVSTRLVRLPEWDALGTATADAVVHLFGRSEYRPRPAQLSVLWNISHPELVTPELCERYDLALVASDRFAEELRGQVDVPVHVLHQATDPERFRPIPDGPAHDLLFVGNSRKVRRRVIDDLLPTELDLAIYGWGWTEELVDLSHVHTEHVPNAQLGGYYAAAAIVLNDHWDDMRAHAFVSNRLYDALAAGAFVISDHVEGIDELFDGAVVTYRDRDELAELVEQYLAKPWAREELAERGRALVLARHTFAHRAQALMGLLSECSTVADVVGKPLHWPTGAARS